MLEFLEQDRLLAQQVILEFFADARFGHVGDGQEQANLFGVAIVELLGIEHQPSWSGTALKIHFIGLDPRMTAERCAEQRAKLRYVPLTGAEFEYRPSGHVLRLKSEGGVEGCAAGYHSEIPVEQQRRSGR